MIGAFVKPRTKKKTTMAAPDRDNVCDYAKTFECSVGISNPPGMWNCTQHECLVTGCKNAVHAVCHGERYGHQPWCNYEDNINKCEKHVQSLYKKINKSDVNTKFIRPIPKLVMNNFLNWLEENPENEHYAKGVEFGEMYLVKQEFKDRFRDIVRKNKGEDVSKRESFSKASSALTSEGRRTGTDPEEVGGTNEGNAILLSEGDEAQADENEEEKTFAEKKGEKKLIVDEDELDEDEKKQVSNEKGEGGPSNTNEELEEEEGHSQFPPETPNPNYMEVEHQQISSESIDTTTAKTLLAFESEDARTLQEAGSNVSLEESVEAVQSLELGSNEEQIKEIIAKALLVCAPDQTISFNFERTKNIGQKFYVNHGGRRGKEIVYTLRLATLILVSLYTLINFRMKHPINSKV